MTVNLVSLASQYLTPDLTDKMASSLGADRNNVKQASTAAIPVLLGSLASLASSRDGAQKIDSALKQNGSKVLEEFTALVGGGGQKSLVDRGISSLKSLFGDSSTSAFAGAVGKFSGIGQSSGSSLIGMLATLVLGLIGRQKAEQHLDAPGLARLLTEQRENIATAIPPGFKNLLQSPGMPNIAGVSGTPPRSAVRATERPAASPGTSRPPQTASRNWLLWALPLIALIALAWWYVSSRTQQVAVPKGTVVEGVELTSALKKTLDNVTFTLQGITDEASARDALPKLDAANTELDKLIELRDQAPANGKQAVASVAQNARPALERLTTQVLAIPGVEDMLKPTVDALRAKINTLSQA